jgi:hypothetical protein
MINITEEQLKEIVTQAHMAGQHNQAHCDPSYFEAETHWQKQVKNIAYEPVLPTVHLDCRECEHNWLHVDNHSDRMYCSKCLERV